jgi:uncharacterized SAM-binding protein YcdF (DUF218 family)
MVGPMPEAPHTRADALVVLGCRIAPSGRPGPAARRRALAAVAAYREGVAGTIVVSGGRRWGARIEARALKATICAEGVPPSAVVEELWSLSTYENALFSAAILRRLGARRAAIVTCTWHMPRALADFRAAGVDALPVPAGTLPEARWRRLYLQAHERVCTWLDQMAMARAEVIAEAAARQGAPA